tara:strand:- start:285 stop:524 length:240 start_codon:yes stop_codon:yes gene_type:complete
MKKKLQGAIIGIGIIGAVLAYSTTPQVYKRYGGDAEYPCDGPTRDCYIPAASSAIRGGGTALLATLAFMGVGVMYKEED